MNILTTKMQKILGGVLILAFLLLAGGVSAHDSDSNDSHHSDIVQRRVSPFNIIPVREAPVPEGNDAPVIERRSVPFVDQDRQDRDEGPNETNRRKFGEENQPDVDTERRIDTLRTERARDGRVVGEERAREAREQALERIRGVALALFDRMAIRMEAAFDRMGRLIERLQSRIEKLEENGIDVEESLQHMEEARTALAEGQTEFEDAIQTMREEVLEAENPRELFGVVRNGIRDAVDSLKEVRESLTDAVRVLKAEVAEDNENNNQEQEEGDSNDETENETGEEESEE